MSTWWVIAAELLPKSVPVLAVCDRNGGSVVVRAIYIHRFSWVSDGEDDLDLDYSETNDEFYYPEGWYEIIDYWHEYGMVWIDDPVTHWMPMPAPPAAQLLLSAVGGAV